MSGASSTDTHQHFLHALRRVLRPIIKLLIRSGIRYDEFADVARGAYVESAVRDGIGELKHPTREQVARITGISLDRVTHYIDDKDALPKEISTLTRIAVEILHKWNTDPRFQDPSGAPRELTLFSGTSRTFEDLVAEVDKKANPQTLLDDLVKSGCVMHSTEDRVRALKRHYTWQSDSASAIEHFGNELEQLTCTLEHNSKPSTSDDKRLERCVFADKGLPQALIAKFHEHTCDRATRFLSNLDDWLARYVDSREVNSSIERVEAGVTVFFYVEPLPDGRPLSALVKRHKKFI